MKSYTVPLLSVDEIRRLKKKWFSVSELSDAIFNGMEKCLNSLMEKKSISGSERFYTGPFTYPERDRKNVIVVSAQSDYVFLCDYLKDEEELDVLEIPTSEISEISYDFEPKELMDSYSGGALYTGAGFLIGGVAGGIVGSVVDDLFNAGRLVKVKVRFSILINFIDGSNRTFDIMNRIVECTPKSMPSYLAQEVEILQEKVDLFSTFLRNNMSETAGIQEETINETSGIQNTIIKEQRENKPDQTVTRSLKQNPTSFSAKIIEEQSKPEINYPDHTRTKQCPKCAETIRLEALVCRFCHHEFEKNEVSEVITKLENEKREAEEKKQKALQEEENEKNKAILIEAKKKSLRSNARFRSVYRFFGLLLLTIGGLIILLGILGVIFLSKHPSQDIIGQIIFTLLVFIMIILPGRAFRKAEKKRLSEITKIKNDIEKISSKPAIEEVKSLSSDQQSADQKQLLAAIREGNWATVSTLLKNGVEPNGIVDENGLSPLDLAKKRNDVPMIKLLKSYDMVYITPNELG